ncbi:MAG TPA: hypothetical protein PKO09_10835 [Anaerolineae bacterium]|nr:hypothetical protein [Anaerolineae bacterium]
MTMTCYTDWKFVGAGKYSKARGLLRYLQYREDRINHAPRAGGAERWVDGGLGRGWREILDNASELQTGKVLLRSLVIRPPQDMLAQLRQADPERWANRLDLMKELVDRVMDAEMQRAGIVRGDGTRQPLDLPYSYVIHAGEDKKGVESPHAHVIVPAMDRDRERPFNVYPRDTQHTRDVAQRETERCFGLERLRDREFGRHVGLDPKEEHQLQPERDWQPSFPGPGMDRDFHGRC